MNIEDETVQLVRNNLVHHLLWNQVEISDKFLTWKVNGVDVSVSMIIGCPSQDLSQDDAVNRNADGLEYVIPVELSQYQDNVLTVERIDEIFKSLLPGGTKRFVMAVVNDDGTVMFYFVYEGIHKPKKN